MELIDKIKASSPSHQNRGAILSKLGVTKESVEKALSGEGMSKEQAIDTLRKGHEEGLVSDEMLQKAEDKVSAE